MMENIKFYNCLQLGTFYHNLIIEACYYHFQSSLEDTRKMLIK